MTDLNSSHQELVMIKGTYGFYLIITIFVVLRVIHPYISILIVAWIFGKWDLSFWLWDRGVRGSSWDPRWSQQPKLQPFAHVLWKKKKKKQSILNNAKDMPFASFVIWVWFTFKRGYGWMYYIIILISHI